MDLTTINRSFRVEIWKKQMTEEQENTIEQEQQDVVRQAVCDVLDNMQGKL